MSGAMIETRGLTRWYGDFLALDHLDLELQEGDLFGFIGPNGAGKSTTMKILATLLAPSEGVARVGGADVMLDPEKVRGLVGYMPDFFGVYREMRVSEYLAFFAAAYRVPARQRERVVADLLTLVDLGAKAEDTVGALSRGMQQRLGLARALVHDPKVLILDEPASGLDPRARVEVREILRELSLMGKTIILSSHILPELANICTRVGVIARGKLRAVGSIEEVSAQVAPPRIHARVVTPERGEVVEGEVADEVDSTRARIGTAVERAAAESLARSLKVPVILHESGLIKVTPSEERAVGPQDVAAALIGQGYGVTHLEPVVPSLEEVFLHLTRDLGLDSEEVEGAASEDEAADEPQERQLVFGAPAEEG